MKNPVDTAITEAWNVTLEVGALCLVAGVAIGAFLAALGLHLIGALV